MVNIQSNSQESLLKDKIRKNCSKDTTEELYAYLDKLVKDNTLDYEKFAKALNEAIDRTGEIKSYFGFITKVARKMSYNEEYKKSWKVCSFVDLHREMHAIGMSGDDVDKVTIDLFEEHVLNEFPISVEEMIEINSAILRWCEEKELLKYSDFLGLLVRSKRLSSCNVPLEEIKTKAKNIVDKINEISAELENETINP